MVEEKKYATCPCCDSKIKWIKQFPLAEITHFERLPLPVLIKGPMAEGFPLQVTKTRFFRKKVIQNPNIPEEIIQRLNQSDEFSYKGRIYKKVTGVRGYAIDDFPDMNLEEFERTFGKSEPGVRIYQDLTADVTKFLLGQERTLKTLEESVGKTMPTKDIFSLLSINHQYPTDLRDFYFGIRENNLGECVLEVESAREEADIHMGCGDGAYMIGFSLGVSKFSYKGLFRER